jgi:hypothetical protein
LAVAFASSAFAQFADVRLVTPGTLTAAPSAAGYPGAGHGLSYSFTVEAKTAAVRDGSTLGFIIYSPDGSLGAVNVHSVAMIAPWLGTGYWTLGGGLLTLDIDGNLPEAILTGGAALPGGGFTAAAFEPILGFTIDIPAVNGFICIDSAFFPPAGEWAMVPEDNPGDVPSWTAGGGDANATGTRVSSFCMETWLIPDQPPTCNTPSPQAASGGHCNPIVVAMGATDPEAESSISYAVTTNTGAGTASVTPSGSMTYLPDPSDFGGSVSIGVTATENDGPSTECFVDITVGNNAPVATCPLSFSVPKAKLGTSTTPSASDADACDSKTWSIVSVNPVPVGTVSVNPATGVVSFDADLADAVGGADTDYEVCLSVSDGLESDECCFTITVLNTEAFCVAIGQVDDQLQGHHAQICIEYEAGSNIVGGFDFLIEYDNSALSFVGATEGSVYGDHQWEYFTYRYGPNGNCTGGCPSGKLRVVGLAETNNGGVHPDLVVLTPGETFACLDFLVSNDRNLNCQNVPIRWCWIDCADNTLSSGGGDTLYISRNVYDWLGSDPSNILSGGRADITGADQSFPTATGAPDDCDVSTSKGQPERFVDFKNGAITIVCADSIDARGDVNLNGLSNEIADAVMFTEYFVAGLTAFGTHIEGSIAATEVNGDGIPLTVADLVYLIRVIVGDALPLPKTVAGSASIVSQAGIVSSDMELGAALFVFEGSADVKLLANNVEIKSGLVDGNTHVLVYSLTGNTIAAGAVVSTTANLLSVEAATTTGAVLSTDNSVLPSEFAVHQNYPNPFNPKTNISMDLVEASPYTVSIYNVAGQLVNVISGEGDAGTVTVEWDAANFASGVYFYKVDVGSVSKTLKMVLLK